ncbi:MAG: hypothetical protein VR78_05115, partial [Hoeflea sp. BRH_c9]
MLQKRPPNRLKPRTIAVRAAPGNRLQAIVRFGSLSFAAALGRGGITVFKREGDGATPRAAMSVMGGFRRGGLLTPDRSGIFLDRVG